ncbi:hypothetical protein RB195_007995 [Necator americanus]|uniref:SCP domain-containing protein n=1 Tax=Necator americanus TaxID=51031 RepID=A0ABR1BZX3_NECAM
MPLLAIVIPVVCHFLSLVPSAKTLQNLPNCEDSRALPSYIQEPLFVEIDIAKGQNPSMAYDCELDVRALNFLRGRESEAEGITYTEFFRESVHYKILAQEAAQNWTQKLQQMGEKKKFGCNLIEDPLGWYRVGCLYE